MNILHRIRGSVIALAAASLAIAPLFAQIYVWRPGVGGFSYALTAAYDPASTAYFKAMGAAHQPDATHKALIDKAIRCTKVGGGWGKLDWLLVPSVDLTASLVDVVNPAKAATAPNGMGLDAYKAFEPDGTDDRLDFGETFDAGTNHFGQDNATIGTWFNGGTPSVSGDGIDTIGTAPVRITQYGDTDLLFALNNGAGDHLTVTAGSHHYTVVRNTSASSTAYADAAVIGGSDKASTTVSTAHAGAFAPGSGRSQMHAALLYSGSAFTSEEVTHFDSCWRTYLQAIAAIS